MSLSTAPIQRTLRIREAMAAAGLDALWLRDTANIAWATAFRDVFDEEQAHTLLITADRVVLHTDSRYSEAARQAAEDTAIEIDDASIGADAFVLKELDKKSSAALTLGIEDTMPLDAYRRLERALQARSAGPQLELKETHDFALELRAVKDADEIEALRSAQAITDEAFEFIVDYIAEGMTEREVKHALDDFMITAGSEGVAFPTIVATGPNAAKPHSVAGDARLQHGQCVVIDFGAVVDGYHADMTRTIALGAPSDEIARAYDAIYEANQSVEEALHPGMTGKEAQELALSILAAAGFEGRMGHSLGHGVGLEIHELPTLSLRNEKPLEVGNVVTVEPGIYIPGAFGMRLEDFGVITENGFTRITQSPHTMAII